MTPTLATGRLSLRRIGKPTPRQVAWLNDPEVMRFSEQRHREHTLHSQQVYINLFRQVPSSHFWGIYRVDRKTHIGNVTAVHDTANNVADVGIMIGESELWGQGYATEAWHKVCEWLLDKDGGAVRKLEAGCMRDNMAMLKIIRSSGFVEEGERKNHFLLGGSPVGMVLFGRFQ
jgi:RimJ/RimL family protein N-acetyltransferase